MRSASERATRSRPADGWGWDARVGEEGLESGADGAQRTSVDGACGPVGHGSRSRRRLIAPYRRPLDLKHWRKVDSLELGWSPTIYC